MPKDATDPNLFTLKVKIGDAEFDASGPKDAVQQQYAEFLAAIKSSQSPQGLTHDVLRRVFGWDDVNPVITLKKTTVEKTTESDAVLLLIFAYKIIKGLGEIPPFRIRVALVRSGLKPDRVDRMVDYQYVEQCGEKRGSRYGINRAGEERAKAIIASIT